MIALRPSTSSWQRWYSQFIPVTKAPYWPHSFLLCISRGQPLEYVTSTMLISIHGESSKPENRIVVTLDSISWLKLLEWDRPLGSPAFMVRQDVFDSCRTDSRTIQFTLTLQPHGKCICTCWLTMSSCYQIYGRAFGTKRCSRRGMAGCILINAAGNVLKWLIASVLHWE